MEAKAAVKTKGDTVAGKEDYTLVDALIEVEDEVLVYAQADIFPQLHAKSVTDNLRVIARHNAKHTG